MTGKALWGEVKGWAQQSEFTLHRAGGGIQKGDLGEMSRAFVGTEGLHRALEMPGLAEQMSSWPVREVTLCPLPPRGQLASLSANLCAQDLDKV